MSWADDYLRQQQGAQDAQQAAGQPAMPAAGGFVSSLLSSIPEMFGDKPTPAAQQFRLDNPWGGVISQLAGSLIPYAATFELSTTAKGAQVLGDAMKALPGVRTLTAVDNPILHAAAKEIVRYSPVELGRLGVGLGTTDDWHDYGNLFADVALSTMITGGAGGIGGLFRVGGPKSLPSALGVEGAPEGLRPTFELRMSRTPGAEPVGSVGMEDVQNYLTKRVLTEVPDSANVLGQKGRYVSGLEGGKPETDALVNVLFRPAVGEKAALKRQPLMDKGGQWTLGEGAMKELLGGLSEKTSGAISTISDLAENAVFPRLVTVSSERAAGTISKALDDSAMHWISDGVMGGKEIDGGLHVIGVRLKAGEVPTTAPRTSQTGKLFIHGGSAFEDVNPALYGTGEPGGIRPLGNGLYGYLVDSSNPKEIKDAVSAAKNYAQKYGKGDKTIHIFDADIGDAQISFNGLANTRFGGKAPSAEQQLITDAYARADALPVGPERSAAFEEARRLAALHPSPVPDVRAEVLPGGLTEAAIHSPERLKRLQAFSADTPDEEIVKAAERALKPDTSPPKIAAGDQWLFLKTDKPNLFAPEGYKLAKLNVEEWAKMREAFRPTGLPDFANAAMDVETKLWTPKDVSEAIKYDKPTFMARAITRLASKFADTAGLKDSETLRMLAGQFYDKIAPTVVNERRSPLFARLLGELKTATQAGDVIVNKAVGGNVVKKAGSTAWNRKGLSHEEGILPGVETVVAAVNKLTKEERIDLYHIGTAQAPLDALEDYTAAGFVSANLRSAVETLQTIDKTLWGQHLLPAFKNAELDGKFDLLNGYIMPRLWTGDHFVPVTDEYGNLKWLGNGTLRQAKHQAQAVIDEAEKAGVRLKMDKPYMLGEGKTPDQVGDLHKLVQMQIGQSADMKEIVQRAMKKLLIERGGKREAANLPKVGGPKSLLEERTGIAGSPDIAEPDAEDIVKAIDNHYKQLFRFAATAAWRKRFISEAKFLEQNDKVLFQDLIRKQHQIMGFEGEITKSLNKALAPVLGQWMGPKAATKIATETNSLLYDWNLAIANPTFSLLNVLQPIQTVAPHLAFLLQAPDDVISADMRMILRHGADGKPRGVMATVDAGKMLGKAIRYMGADMPDELRQFHAQAKMDGTTGAQLYEGFIGGQSQALETIGDTYKRAGFWEATKKGLRFFAERSEEVSRAIAFNSYYTIGKDYFKLEGDQLYRFMQNGTRNSMFGYSLMDRSRIFTGPVGSMFGLFKNWQMHFISSMFQYAGLGIKHNAWGPFVWQFGSAMALGGLGAMGPLKWTADALASWHDGSPNSYLWMQEHWHDSADELYFGFPALFGASLQASSTLPGTDVRNDLTSLSSFVALERAKAAGKATGAAWDYATVNGQDPLRNPNIRDQLLQAYAPRAVFRAFASVEGDYIKSMSTGYPQVRDVSPLSKFFYAAGLNQVEVDRQQVAARELWKDQEAQRKQIAQLGVALANAQLNNDFDEMERVNTTAMLQGVPVSKVYASARTRLNREQNQDLLSRYRGDMAAQYKQAWSQ